MGNPPIKHFKESTISVNQLEDGNFTVKKSFKKKDATKWEDYTIKLFKSELLIMQTLINKMVAELGDVEVKPTEEQQEGKPASFTEDDIPF